MERATPESAESEELGIAINEALGIASYITDDGDPTQSIDAARTLIPEDATGWSLNNDRLENEALIFRAGDGVIGRGNARTPALALCAASLKARMGTAG